MYAVTSMPLVRRTRATFRSAEFGFFGVLVYTRVQTPRRCGAPFSAGVLVLELFDSRPLRTSCAIVGTTPNLSAKPLRNFLAWARARRRSSATAGWPSYARHGTAANTYAPCRAALF